MPDVAFSRKYQYYLNISLVPYVIENRKLKPVFLLRSKGHVAEELQYLDLQPDLQMIQQMANGFILGVVSEEMAIHV